MGIKTSFPQLISLIWLIALLDIPDSFGSDTLDRNQVETSIDRGLSQEYLWKALP